MKNRISFSLFTAFLLFGISCHKATTRTDTGIDFITLEQQVINDFTSNTAIAQYFNLVQSASELNNDVESLNALATDSNLVLVQNSWRSLRQVWEQCEGFLFGPVEDNDYDPNTDTWPTDYVQMDSLLASNNPLQLSDIQLLPQSLRGYHPVEYLVFGVGGKRKASDLTSRQKQYLSSLAGDLLYNNIQPLYESWISSGDGYAQQVINAGNGSEKFPRRLDLFLAITDAMSDICGEVGSGKMFEPFAAKDSLLTESPYSGNTLTDFKSNITGLKWVYTGMNGFKGLKDLVAEVNKDLDNRIQKQMEVAIHSFDLITVRYEEAIFSQRVQVQQTMDALNVLNELIENDLRQFIIQNIKD